ncbi:hypothetical protein BKI52_17405 [marine bacterium AO1-C]|nr:hypothetical protein BKI52_17405 [marine bacterium AO1-C]
MRYLNVLLLSAVLFLALASCDQKGNPGNSAGSNDDLSSLLAKDWAIDTTAMNAYFAAAKTDSSLKPYKGFYSTKMITSFRENGVFGAQMLGFGNFNKFGNWKLEGKIITISNDQEKVVMKMKIDKLTDEKLVLDREDGMFFMMKYQN